MDRNDFQNSETLEKATAALRRIQEFDPKSLEQRERLGSENSFDKAVEPARQIGNLFNQLPISSLRLLPNIELDQIKHLADGTYNIFKEIKAFSVSDGDVDNRKNALVDNLWNQTNVVFLKLYPLVSFAMAKTVDFASLENQARSAIQSVRDQTKELIAELEKDRSDSRDVLQEVRKSAAEQGISQEAFFFSQESQEHEDNAKKWLWASVFATVMVTLYAVFTLFIPKIPLLSAETVPEAVQLAISKLLIFLVLVFALLQCVKNYSAHRHNAVANKHRQNALMTYKTLAEAGGSQEARDAILQHAAAAEYAPGDTGYVRGEERGYSGNPVIGLSPRSMFGNINTIGDAANS